MGLVPELQGLAPARPTVVTVGHFEGVHQGHQHLLAQVRAEAAMRGAWSAAVTLYPHARTLHEPGYHHIYLESLEERLTSLRQQGIDLVVCLAYTQELAQLSARQFVTALVEDLHMVGMVAGPDHTLGRQREGTIPVLQELGRELGFGVTVVEPYVEEGEEVVSSSAIRRRLEGGDVVQVSRLLGRPFSLRGPIERGDGRGRALGYPTANLRPPEGIALPADGIYATRAHLGSAGSSRERAELPSVTNVGVRPTFGAGPRLVEVHLLDFEDRDLYGQMLGVEFLQRLRAEEHYDSAEVLVDQMARDVDRAREVLAGLWWGKGGTSWQ